jgi:protein TonB
MHETLMSTKYTDKYIEKTFLYLLAFSILLHAALFALVIYLPEEKKKPATSEPIMIDLQDLPPSKISPRRQEKEVKRKAEERRRVAREIAPRGEMQREKLFPSPTQPQPQGREMAPKQSERGIAPVPEEPRGESLLKPREQKPVDLARLFPSAEKMARLEDSYRKKYSPEVEEGDTRFLNTDDIQFGSFLRRFETAVYGVWRYPQEAVRMGIEGVTPVRITFNRKGEIQKVEILEGGSGSKILDDEVRRTLRDIGPIGSFPKGYDKDTFNLIAFFQYGIVRGMSRGMLH